MAENVLIKIPEQSPVGANDRLAFTVFVAVAVHLLIVLGIGFEALKKESQPLSNLEVIFLQNPEPKQTTDKADYLAQISQEGGGNTEEKLRPESPPASELPSDNPDFSDAQQVEMFKTVTKPKKEDLLMDRPSEQADLQKQDEPPLPDDTQAPVTAERMVLRSKQIESLNAQVSMSMQMYSRMPRQKFISAATQEYTAASYMAAWQEKVERIGNINYPEAARTQNLYGSLLMDVALRPDGSIQSIEIKRSSGKQVLDDAAMRIVRLAGPFAEFPEELRKDTDILHIIRTWQFQKGGILSTR